MQSKITALRENLKQAMIGKDEILELVLTVLFGGGHILLEDVPGVGKTTLARALADSVDCSFARIQFTPDTLPSDLCGVSIYHPETGTFEVQKGAAFHQIILADELNRTSPKTQSALLESMEEHQISIDGTTYFLEEPYFVIATENPLGAAGTYVLPEATLDRFWMKLSIGYPDEKDAILMVKKFLSGELKQEVKPVLSGEEVLEIQKKVREVTVHEDLIEKMNQIVTRTRTAEGVRCGASPRALLQYLRSCQSAAYLDGRDYVIPEDLVRLAVPVLAHRLVLKAEAKMGRITGQDIVEKLVRSISFTSQSGSQSPTEIKPPADRRRGQW